MSFIFLLKASERALRKANLEAVRCMTKDQNKGSVQKTCITNTSFDMISIGKEIK